MIIKNAFFMKASLPCIMVFVLAITSCAQQQKKAEQAIPKEQSKIVMLQKVKMPVDGMTCSACQSNVKKTIKSFDGVTDVEVNLEKKFAFFTYNPSKVNIEQIKKAVNDKGYSAGKTEEIKQ